MAYRVFNRSQYINNHENLSIALLMRKVFYFYIIGKLIENLTNERNTTCKSVTLIATAAMGLESIVANEVRNLDMKHKWKMEK